MLIALHLLLAKTRFGRLIRAATQDREMVGALGVNQALLFTAVFACGSALAGLGGALQLAREPANLAMDLTVLGDAFVVVVVGGMGSITGAYLAAVIIAEIKALCIGIGVVHFGGMSVNFSKLTLVAEFLVMAVVLIVRPYGLLGRPQVAVRNPSPTEDPTAPAAAACKILGRIALVARSRCCRCSSARSPYALVLGIDVLIAVLFATSLHFIMGPGGMHSFGHAAYFGLGAYGAALLVKFLALPMPAALRVAPLVAGAGRAAVRLVRGAALRRLSRDAHARVRADRLGHRVPVGEPHRRLERRARRLADRAVRQPRSAYFLLTLALRGRAACCCCGACCSRRSATRCGPAATRRCAPKRSASTSSACIGSASPSPARSAGSPARCSPSPRARSRRRPSRSAARSTAW